jgi:LacI family transcriptional regulator
VKHPTIYQIAEICGVSSATVSRAFSRPELVNESVRRRIEAVVEQIGYRPNRAAKGLATGRTSMLGLLVPDITNPFLPPLVRSIQQAAAGVGCSILLVDAQSDASLEATLIGSLHGQVDGLILASPRAPSSVLHQAVAGLPCVVLNRVIRDLPSVVCDNSLALEEAGALLVGLGHRRIALLCGPVASWAAQRRAQAVVSWARAAGVALEKLGPFDASFEGGLAAGARLLAGTATAAFAFDDVMAAGVVAELADRGVRVPKQRSLVGCDDVLLARMITPSLTTITAPVTELGQAAVDVVHELVGAAHGHNRVIRLQASLTVRASTGKAPRQH